MTNDPRPFVEDDFDVEHIETAPYTKAQARRVTEMIKLNLIGLWYLIADAYKGRIWVPLGYANWDDYCTNEIGVSRIRLPREERTEVVASLRKSGLSDRAIESATGVSRRTLIRDRQSRGDNVTTSGPVDDDVLAQELIAAHPPIIGTDGKTYPPRELTAYQKERKARDEAEAALTPQERARRQKEADAFAHEIGDQMIASLSGVMVNNVISCLDELADDIRQLIGRGGVTSEQLRGIEAAHARYATSLDVLRMSERDLGMST